MSADPGWPGVEEKEFLRAIGEIPDDDGVRLVYADWLEERGDPRAAFVRAQVALGRSTPSDPQYSRLLAIERELRAACPEYWLALLDPPVWCAAGNVVGERLAVNSEGLPLRGTPLFRPGAKIYLSSLRDHWCLTSPEGSRHYSVEVIGQHRASRKWIGSFIKVRATTNWRVQLVYQPGARLRLREAGWPGFSIPPKSFECPPDRQSTAALTALFEAINRTSLLHGLSPEAGTRN